MSKGVGVYLTPKVLTTETPAPFLYYLFPDYRQTDRHWPRQENLNG